MLDHKKISEDEKELVRRLKILENSYKQGLFSVKGKPYIELKMDGGPGSEVKKIPSELNINAKIQDDSPKKQLPVIKKDIQKEAKPDLVLRAPEKILKTPVKLETSIKIQSQRLKKGLITKKFDKDLKSPEKKTFNEKPAEHSEDIHPEDFKISQEVQDINPDIKKFADMIHKLKREMARVIVGQEKVINGLIRGLICNGHVLLEGVPGIAKTLTIRALGEASGCAVKRIQFTVDLLPTDIIGITSYTPQKGFEIVKGPIFANFLIADEINRSPPKTQSALIEAMQEKQVTIGKTNFPLPNPFFVMATKNPLESTGVYSLPEAQMDRFLFNLIMEYPNEDEERKIMEDNATLNRFEDFHIKSVITPQDIIEMQKLVKKIYLSDHIKSYIIGIVKKTRDKNFKYSDCIAYGASPRASIALFIASKARALSEGRSFVLPEDVKEVLFDVLRHRIILTYKATIRGVSVEDVIKSLIEEVKV
ncbi:ATPase family associated with various cellular activities (AAA) [uncultured archaeon]|nr:ATPase family associated with various cellular activities (AAA) [uncultured archaeon]